MRPQRELAAALGLCSFFLLPPVACSQTEPAAGAVAAATREAAGTETTASPIAAAEAEAFFDGLLGAQLRHLDTAGAAVALVGGGEVLFAKGYGYADLANGIEVDPEKTLFRIGSVSKLFVWTAVMQLVEEGRLDLHTDIAEYLPDVDFHRGWGEPVTLAHLMTHSPGFEDRVLGLFSRDEEALGPLAEVLAAQTPAQVRPPGERPSYSNHGTTMAALVVETVSGLSFRDFVRERILDPLGMENTSLDQPLPEALTGQMSKGYRHAGDHFEEEDFELIPLYPAGNTSASAIDMAQLMIAYLQDGRLGEARILEEDTARTMRSALLRVDPAVNTSPHGFLDMSTRGVRILGHGGDTFWFHTLFALFPERDLGLFVSYNTDKGSGGRTPLLQAFLDRYFAPPARPSAPPADFAERAASYTGEFRANRFSHTTLAKLGAVAGAFEVEVNDDGELVAFDDRFVETAPRVFTARDGERTLVFIEGDEGVMSHFYDAQYPIVTFERVPAHERRKLHLALLLVSVALLAATVVAWPAGWAVRRWFAVRDPSAARLPRSARLALWLGALALTTMLVALVAVMSDPTDAAFGELGAIRAILVLPLVALLPFAFVLLSTVRMWRGGLGTRTGRVLYTLTVVAAAVFYWQLSVWNLLGFRL